jgi:repressor LexA
MSLTARQSQMLDLLRKKLAHSEVGPSFDELAEELEMAKSNVHRIAHALKERGYIEFLPRRARSIRIVEKR